jgi:trk system potassium uptake protein TrkA
VGAGKIGRNLAKYLTESGNQLTIIDKDEVLCKSLASAVDALVIHGDVTKVDTLENAEVSKADVLIAVTDRDEVNLLACLIAREHGVPRVIARVSDPDLSEIFEHMGVEKAICPEVVTSHVIENLISGRFGIVELVRSSTSDLKLLEVTVNENSDAVGKKLGEIYLPSDSMVLEIYERDKYFAATRSHILRAGDKLIILVKAEAIEEVKKIFSS